MRKGFYKKKDKKLQNFTAKIILAHIKNLNNNKIMEFIKKEEIKIPYRFPFSKTIGKITKGLNK